MDVSNVAPAGAKPAVPEPVKVVRRRMSLDAVDRGVKKEPFRIWVHGLPKVGKSTFAAGAPNPIFLNGDAGTNHLDIARMPIPENWQEVLEGLAEIASRGRTLGYETFVADPLNWFEPLAIASFTGDPATNLAKWGGGHGAGYSALGECWRNFFKGVERIRNSGMNIILISHTVVKKFDDPQGPGFERYEPSLDKRGAGLFREWVDAILFAKQESFGKLEEGGKKYKAGGSAANMLHTRWTPAYDAGNRYGLPETIPLSWDEFWRAKERAEVNKSEARERIEAMLVELADAEVEKRVRGYLAKQNVDLLAVENAVTAKLGAAREARMAATKAAPTTTEEKANGAES